MLEKIIRIRMSWQESMKALFRKQAKAIPYSQSLRQIVQLIAGTSPTRIRFA